MTNPPFEELPELTLSLRSFGSRRGQPDGDAARAVGQDQERFFAPLLDARRRAAEAHAADEVLSAFDARRLTAALDAAVRTFAAERSAGRAAAQRALEAELLEIIEPLRSALQQLREESEQLLERSRHEAGQDAGARWSAWLERLRLIFRIADATWQPLADVLTRVPTSSGQRAKRDKGGRK
jgi:DNA anti-recombination protein RmuC